MKADPKADAAPAANGKKKLMVMIIAGVLVAGLGGGAAWFFTKGSAAEEGDAGGHKTKKEKKKSGKEAPPVYVVLEQFTVNLQPENGDQYLQLACTLQVNSPEQEELLKANMPKVRSRILLLLSGKKASELSSVEGKKKLAEDIIKVVNEPFTEHGEPQEVSDVLFTSFIIQ